MMQRYETFRVVVAEVEVWFITNVCVVVTRTEIDSC